MTALPDGFVLDAPQPPAAAKGAAPELPPGFVMDAGPDISGPLAKRMQAFGAMDQAVDTLPFGKDVAALAHARPVARLAAMLGLIQKPDGTFGEKFREGRKVEDAASAQYGKESPWKSGAAKVAGSLFLGAPARAGGMALAATQQPATLMGRVAQNAGIGAGFGAAEGLSESDKTNALQAAKDAGNGALAGGVTGAALPLVAEGVSRMIRPEAKTLMEAGVKPTTGQLFGGLPEKIETGLQNVPLVGGAVRDARQQALNSYQRAVINNGLAPIGETIPEKTPLGREAISAAWDKIDGAYDKLKLKSIAVDPVTAFAKEKAAAQLLLPKDEAARFGRIIDDTVLSKVSATGDMDGKTFKGVRSALRDMAYDLSHDESPAQQALGKLLGPVQSSLNSLAERSNPALVKELKSAGDAYGRMMRIGTASARATSDAGSFGPKELLSAARQLDTSGGKRAFQTGNAVMQPLAQAGTSVLSKPAPAQDWKQYLLGLAMEGAPVGAAHYFGALPATAPIVGGALAAGRGVYSRPGQAAVNTLLTNPPLNNLAAQFGSLAPNVVGR